MNRFKFHCEAKSARQQGISSTLDRKTLQHLLNPREKKNSCFIQQEESGYYSSLVTANKKAETSAWLYAEEGILHLIVSDAEQQFEALNRFYNQF